MSDLDDIRDRLKSAPEPEYKPGEAVSDVAAKRTVAEIAERLKLNPDFVSGLFEELAEQSGKRLEGVVSAVFDSVAPFLSGDAVKVPQVNYWAVRLPRSVLSPERLRTIAKSSCGWPDATKVIMPSTHTEGAYLLASPTRTAAILKPDNDDDVWMIPLFESVVAYTGDRADYKWSCADDTFELSIFGEDDDRKMVVTIPMGALSEDQRNEVDDAIKGEVELISAPWFQPGMLSSKPNTMSAWSWANPAERDAQEVTAADIGKVGLIRRDGTYWQCITDADPTRIRWKGPVENPDLGCVSCWDKTTDDPAGCVNCGRNIPMGRASATRGPVGTPKVYGSIEDLKDEFGTNEITMPREMIVGAIRVSAGDTLQVNDAGELIVNGRNYASPEIEKKDKVAVTDEVKVDEWNPLPVTAGSQSCSFPGCPYEATAFKIVAVRIFACESHADDLFFPETKPKVMAW